MVLSILLQVGVVAAILALAVTADSVSDQPTPIRVATYNIRFGTATDGPNAWPNRREMLIDQLRRLDADVVGLQEALAFQVDEIVQALPGYGAIGVGRDDGIADGEHCTILYRTSRLRVDRSGTFWLSDTPDVVASKTWGNEITRICTWATFVDRRGVPFSVFNAHLDHVSQPSRERSVRLIVERAKSLPRSGALVVMGDFNAGDSNPAVAWMTGSGGAGYRSAYRRHHPNEPASATFNGFDPKVINGEPIDHVFVEASTRILNSFIDRAETGGRLPSDHLPVVADLAFASG